MNFPTILLLIGAVLAFEAALLVILTRRIGVLREKVDLMASALRVRNDALVTALHDRHHARAVVEDVPGYKHKVARINWPSSDRPPEA